MFYLKFSILFFLSFLFIGLLSRLSLLDAPGKYKRVFFIWGFSKKPYFRLQNRITGKIERALARMKPSSRESKKKDKDKELLAENDPRRVQRRQREALKTSACVPLDTCNLNLDALTLFLKYAFYFLITCIVYFLSGSLFTLSFLSGDFFTFKFLHYNFLPFIFFYLLTHVLITRLVLRHSRFYFWRSWPLLFHRYTEGLLPENYDKTLYILLLPIPVIWYFAGFLIYFIGLRWVQNYPLSRFKRTWGFYSAVYAMGISGVIIRAFFKVYNFIKYYVRRVRRKLRPIWRFFFPKRKKKIKKPSQWTIF